MEKTYQVSESELIELIHDSMKLCALENGGVDNWILYIDSIQDFEKANGSELYELNILPQMIGEIKFTSSD